MSRKRSAEKEEKSVNIEVKFEKKIDESRKRRRNSDENPENISFPEEESLKNDLSTEISPDYKKIPSRDSKGRLFFEDFPAFRPNLTPEEVLRLGSFGGTYFRPIYSAVTKKRYGSEVWKELPPSWLKGLDVKLQVANPVYDKNQNKYKVKSGASLEEWEGSNWIKDCDPYGWFQWYCRFYQGRRCADDERQVSRGLSLFGPTGRWLRNLSNKIVASVEAGGMIAPGNPGYPGKKTLESEVENYSISPVIRQTLQHWGYKISLHDFKKPRPFKTE